MGKRLTKSRFSMGLSCHQKLIFEAAGEVYVDQRKTSAILEGLAEGGFQLGALARTLFRQADGLSAFEIDAEGQEEQIAQTVEALKKESVTLFEPTIVFDDYLVRVDVLRKRGTQIELIEVKSKSFNSKSDKPDKNPLYWTKDGDIHSAFLDSVRDLAFQYWVLRQAYPAWNIQCYLMMPDTSVPAREDALHKRLSVVFDAESSGSDLYAKVDAVEELSEERLDDCFLTRIPMDQQVKHVLNDRLAAPAISGDFASVTEKLAAMNTAELSMRPAPVGAHCKSCEFYTPSPSEQAKSGFHECWSDRLDGARAFQREDMIFGLYNPAARGSGSTAGLLEAGYHWLADIDPDVLGLPAQPNGKLTTKDRQRMQLTGEWPGGGDYYFDRSGFAEALDKCDWPLYFLDFEAARSALPFRSGMRPNSIQIFQYSLHVMEHDGQVRHADEFLDLSVDGDVNIRMLRRLREALGSTGTILRWTDYENTVLSSVREHLLTTDSPPEDRNQLVTFIESIIRSGEREMVDQAKWAQHFYFHPHSRGSNSIKLVLPAVMMSSEYLRSHYARPIYGTEQTAIFNPVVQIAAPKQLIY
ncbi:DUF2779 domain-containing protein [Marinobacter sp. S6332]|uniref:DUF2779 domain-containing protein n=1 Tax=Marinobacter sp. S6332 TaxID=2926403 RepID=UPI001FF2011C|nr:DUF2779 domain-containing protein [Marinobacter sp. S6332]MCK0165909.1 DUF2779 domain-containing protein [Marinobacter sp. S6332]